MNEKLLEVKNLEVIYKTDLETVRAVNGIDFTLNKGETLGIVGETGAGKTTTALTILRLLPSNIGRVLKGSIEFVGVDLLKISEHEMRDVRGKRISMIFQDPMTALNPLETVGDQIAEALLLQSDGLGRHRNLGNPEGINGRLRKGNKEKGWVNARVDEVLTLVGIPPFRKREYPHQFSGGMMQRVVIAIALACEPELLIADEPTTALDVTIQAQVLAMIKALRDKFNTSMIMITHDLGIVAQICDQVAVMYAGEFIEYGSAEDIFNSGSNHPYTRGLFGSIPNIKIDTNRLSPIDGLMPDPTDLPKGCKFSPRCPFCMDICREKHPEDFHAGSHRIKCFLFEQKQNTNE
jgi:peptide/nickel transport system ATP-binding protein